MVAVTAIGLLLYGGLVLPVGALVPQSANSTAGAPLKWLAWTLVTLLLTARLWGVRLYTRLSATSQLSPTLVRLATAIALSVGAFLLLWAAILLVPGLQVRRLSAFHSAFAVPLYLWPWLLCPLSLVYATRRLRM